MSFAARRWIPVLALVAACALPSPFAIAGDEPTGAPSDRDRAVAAALESANIRMKAKLEEATILERLGRHDEALAALRAVETIHRDGVALVERLAAPVAPAAPVLRVAPGSPARLRVRVEPPTVEASFPPRHVAAATTYLMGAQRIDGWFRSGSVADVSPAADLDEGRDFHTTGLAVVALLDALDDDLQPVRVRDAASRGIEALLSAQSASGAFGDGKDLEAHALATWAIGAGAARLPSATWRPAAQQAIAKAVAFALAARDEGGLWGAGTGSSDVDWILSAWMATALHEIHSLPRSFVRDVDLGVVLNRVQLGARAAYLSGVAATSPTSQFARALLVVEKLPEQDGILPTSAEDDVALLFGTTLRFGRSDGFEAWQDEVLTRSQRRQRQGGPFDGSWDPSGARAMHHGRTYATACRLLAALVPVVPYREPAGD